MNKRCPQCFQTYSDISLNYCLDDGSVLTNSLDLPTKSDDLEIETIVRSSHSKKLDSPRKDDWLQNWAPERTIRTLSKHPISTSPKTTNRPFAEWTASDFLREITYLVTDHHTVHAQECLELLRRFLNRYIGNERQLFHKSTWQNGKGHFCSQQGVLTYDFQRGAEPSARDLLLNLVGFLSTESDNPSLAERFTPSTRKRRLEHPGLEYIRTAVKKYPNLELLVHQGNNHRIMKNGHVGSVWIVPRKGGLSITANGQAANRLYQEMEMLLGPHHKIDQKGYRYFQSDSPADVEKIIQVWSAL